MNCVRCRKRLKKGEFIVLNGGAMVKTKTGAVMGDKNLLGFLTVCNHFDSKKSYQSMIIANDGTNGQFELYACSHKCLIVFITRQIKSLEIWCKNDIKIVSAPTSHIEKIESVVIDKVLAMLGFKRAYVTDESRVYDFIGVGEDINKYMTKINEKFKKYSIKINASDLIYKIAKKLTIAKKGT